MPDIIKFKGKDYTVKRKLSFYEVRQFQKTLSNVIGLGDKIKSASDAEMDKIAREGIQNNEAQMEIVYNTIKSSLGFTDKDFKKTDFLDAIMLFNEIYEDSTIIKKKSKLPYA